MSDESTNLDPQKSYRDSIQKVIESSESDFETKITYISAGALGLSITFAEKFVKIESANCMYLLIFGWVFLVLTLSVNLASALISKHYSMLARKEIDNGDDKVYENITRRNSSIDKINWASVGLLFVGIILIVTYVSINLTQKKSEGSAQNVKPADSNKNEAIKIIAPIIKDSVGN